MNIESTLLSSRNAGEALGFPSRSEHSIASNYNDITTLDQNSWHIKSNNGLPSKPGTKTKIDVHPTDKKDLKVSQSIEKDLDSISNSLHRLEQQNETLPVFANASLRQTEQGKALHEGNDIRSRRVRRNQESSKKMNKQNADPSPEASSGSTSHCDVPAKAKTVPEIKTALASENEGNPASFSHDSLVSLDQKPEELVSSLSMPTTSLSQANSPTRSPTRLKFCPTGPSQALREGKEEERRFLRLLELSELMIEKKRTITEEPVKKSRFARTMYRGKLGEVGENDAVTRDDDKDESNSSVSTDTSNGDDGSDHGASNRFYYDASSLRPGFVRGMSFDRIEEDVPYEPPPIEDENGPLAVNSLRPSYVRGLSCERLNKSEKTRRGGRRPKSRQAGDDYDSEEDEDEQVVKHRPRGGKRPCRPKRNTLRPPGDTSSDEDEERDRDDFVDLRETLQAIVKTFRKKPLVYRLAKRKRDYTLEITRKRSIRPKIGFIKILPGMRPTVKGLLKADDGSTDESDVSSTTPTMDNRVGQETIKECFQDEIANMGKDDPVRRRRKKATWNAPRATPPPCQQEANDKPKWAEPHLKPTGQKEKIETLGNLAKPITFPIKEETTKTNWRSGLRSTEQGEAIQGGREIISRRARRQQELRKLLQRSQQD